MRNVKLGIEEVYKFHHVSKKPLFVAFLFHSIRTIFTKNKIKFLSKIITTVNLYLVFSRLYIVVCILFLFGKSLYQISRVTTFALMKKR